MEEMIRLEIDNNEYVLLYDLDRDLNIFICLDDTTFYKTYSNDKECINYILDDIIDLLKNASNFCNLKYIENDFKKLLIESFEDMI